MGSLNPTHKPDYSNSEPPVSIPPNPAWYDPTRPVTGPCMRDEMMRTTPYKDWLRVYAISQLLLGRIQVTTHGLY